MILFISWHYTLRANLGQTGPKSQIHHLLAEWFWVSYKLYLPLLSSVVKWEKKNYLLHESERIKMAYTAVTGTQWFHSERVLWILITLFEWNNWLEWVTFIDSNSASILNSSTELNSILKKEFLILFHFSYCLRFFPLSQRPAIFWGNPVKWIELLFRTVVQ